MVTRSSVIAANLPHAAGVAYASKLRGLDEVSICYFGEGATSEGDFHEAMNFASIHKLPVVFFCENNGYAISESSEKQMAVLHVADRAKGYNMIGQTVDGNDVIAVHQTAHWSIEECRRGRGPKLIEAKTYRLVPHTSSDDDRRYRTRAELEEWIKRDPIDRFRKRLRGGRHADRRGGRSDPRRGEARGGRGRRGGRARARSGAGGRAAARLRGRGRRLMPEKSYIEAIHDALWEEMERLPAMIVLGEDIQEGGVFRVTDGMLERFGRSACSIRRWPNRASSA